MKIKELFYLLGLKPKPKKYPHRIDLFELQKEGPIRFANWTHPACTPKKINQRQVDALRSFIKEGDFAIDIGAHIGDTTLPIALATGAKGKVAAFEPNPYAFEVLAVNSLLNQKETSIDPFAFAASDSDKTLTFSYSDAGYCNGGEHKGISRWKHAHAFEVDVKAVAIEPFLEAHYADFLPKLRFIKVDCEGADLAILKALGKILKKYTPYLQAEVYKHLTKEERINLFEYLRQLNYQLYELKSQECYQGNPLTLKTIVEQSHFDLFAIPAK